MLWNANPNPKWVAPPGTSLHRWATELDLGPTAAYDWLWRNHRRFGFIRRYAWACSTFREAVSQRIGGGSAFTGHGMATRPLAGLPSNRIAWATLPCSTGSIMSARLRVAGEGSRQIRKPSKTSASAALTCAIVPDVSTPLSAR